ncbi:MAG: sigma 54-interacting transcriptional regulator [Bacteroidetes bacterium]|nr:sigma 54-interacting transcriptional regulator [Bacteroidota bacterium]
MKTSPEKIQTLGQLKASGYQPCSIKQELRENLILQLKAGKNPFPGIMGYEHTVIPQLETAILGMQNILLLGLRGQAKTRLARQMVRLLDPLIPVISGSELNDDPLQPLSRYGRDLVVQAGEDTPVDWLPAEARYVEKLATPDVTVADLIGDLDPIKAANLKLSYADERAIHFGLIPRAHRSLFVINELPDLQARIQVALFNILQEQDIQIRGFRLRLPLDVQFVFTANPEDYTSRGSIVTPLKDRIGSQILTHYPESLEVGQAITRQEARHIAPQRKRVQVLPLLEELIERVAAEARTSEYVDAKSGVSARLTISALEHLYSAVELRLLQNGMEQDFSRVGDLYTAIPAITGKIELVYEGEQEGPYKVAYMLIGQALRQAFLHRFPDPEKLKKAKAANVYEPIIQWFNSNHSLELLNDLSTGDYATVLRQVPQLARLVQELHPGTDKETQLVLMELVLYGLSECSQLSKHTLPGGGARFGDMLGDILGGLSFAEEEEDSEEG